MSLFLCPLCRCDLHRNGRQYCCPAGHTYDISAEGYTNLLLPNQKNAKLPGDNKEMVQARSLFLNKGYYQCLWEALRTAIWECTGNIENPAILDCGCGEGYYTQGIYELFQAKGRPVQIAAVDISKLAVKKAAKRNHEIAFAVASVFSLPVKNAAANAVLNCFSPMCESEFRRVLQLGGTFIYVVPATDHLWQMKEILYENPYPNQAVTVAYEGFRHEKTIYVKDKIKIQGRQDIQALFAMTPYFWRTPKKGAEALQAICELETVIGFDIHIYSRTKERVVE